MRARAIVTHALVALSALAIGFVAGRPSKPPVSEIEPLPPPSRPPCVKDVAAKLDTFDVAGALALACDDARSRAEAEWLRGNVSEAAQWFAKARQQWAAEPFDLTEVEAAILTEPAKAGPLVASLARQWYRGPRDESQRAFECIGRWLAPSEKKGAWRVAYCGPISRTIYAQNRRYVHFLPAYAMHDPIGYALLQPLAGPDTTYGVGCASSIDALSDLSDRECRVSMTAMHAVFAAVIGDRARLGRELETLRAFASDLDRFVDTFKPSAADRETYDQAIGHMASVRGQVIAVGVAAALFAHDEEGQRKLLPWMKGHERAIYDEHLALVRGEQRLPAAAHSPSDYAKIDMEMFNAASDSPETFAKRVVDARYVAPTKLAAMLGARPAHREALRPFVRERFPAPCRTCGIHALLRSVVSRREIARTVGEESVAREMSDVAARIGAALLVPEGFPAVTSLEGIVSGD